MIIWQLIIIVPVVIGSVGIFFVQAHEIRASRHKRKKKTPSIADLERECHVGEFRSLPDPLIWRDLWPTEDPVAADMEYRPQKSSSSYGRLVQPRPEFNAMIQYKLDQVNQQIDEIVAKNPRIEDARHPVLVQAMADHQKMLELGFLNESKWRQVLGYMGEGTMSGGPL
jgi:hypothetical protein